MSSTRETLSPDIIISMLTTGETPLLKPEALPTGNHLEILKKDLSNPEIADFTVKAIEARNNKSALVYNLSHFDSDAEPIQVAFIPIGASWGYIVQSQINGHGQNIVSRYSGLLLEGICLKQDSEENKASGRKKTAGLPVSLIYINGADTNPETNLYIAGDKSLFLNPQVMPLTRLFTSDYSGFIPQEIRDGVTQDSSEEEIFQIFCDQLRECYQGQNLNWIDAYQG